MASGARAASQLLPALVVGAVGSCAGVSAACRDVLLSPGRAVPREPSAALQWHTSAPAPWLVAGMRVSNVVLRNLPNPQQNRQMGSARGFEGGLEGKRKVVLCGTKDNVKKVSVATCDTDKGTH